VIYYNGLIILTIGGRGGGGGGKSGGGGGGGYGKYSFKQMFYVFKYIIMYLHNNDLHNNLH